MDRLELVTSTIKGYFDDLGGGIFDNFRDDFSFGKMLRSKLIFAIAPKSHFSIRLCAIVELIHFASLLHDDVIDDSILRRGKTSINAKYGNKNAIMLGDILYSKAFYEISSMDSSLAKIISNAVLKLSLGELEDVELSKAFNLDEDRYFRMINNKTASLIEASAHCAGIINGDASDKYKIYGNALGIAFQIVDDVLDITQTTQALGKSAFSDLKEGKTTLPYIYLFKSMDENERNELLLLFKKELSQSDISWIKGKLDKYDILQQIKEVIDSYANKAIGVLEVEDAELRSIIFDMISRES